MTVPILIVDKPQQRVWEADPDIPLEKFTDVIRHPTTGEVLATRTYWAPERERMYEELRSTLPPVERRDPRQRLESMILRISEDWLAAYRETGRGHLPRSVEVVLGHLAERDHDPRLRTEARSVEDYMYQATAFARYLADTGVRQQAEQDGRKVTLDWAGH